MQPGHHKYSIDEINARMDAAGVRPALQESIRELVVFHTSPAPGVLIGAFMVDYALELLGVTADEKLYGVCETPKCLPDALQVIAHATTGNDRLRVIPIGKFAITVNAATQESTAEAVRVYSQTLPNSKNTPSSIYGTQTARIIIRRRWTKLSSRIFSVRDAIFSRPNVSV